MIHLKVIKNMKYLDIKKKCAKPADPKVHLLQRKDVWYSEIGGFMS